MKKQTVDVFEKGDNNLPFHKAISQSDKDTIATISAQIFADQLEREQSDKLWLLFAKGLALFVVGYMAYHFIRFLMM